MLKHRPYVLLVVCSAALAAAGCRAPGGAPPRPRRLDRTSDAIAPMTERQSRAVAPVVESLADELAAIAARYPELYRYSKQKALWRSKRGLGLHYSNNFAVPKTRRRERPSDFGKHGFYISFGCARRPHSDGADAMRPPRAILRRLDLQLWAFFRTSDEPSPGLEKVAQALLQKHVQRLEEIDAKAARMESP